MGVWRIPIVITGPALPGPAANIWHVRTGQAVGDATYEESLQDALNAIHTFYDSIKGLYPAGNTISFDGEVQELAAAEPRVADGLTFADVAGTGGDGMPAANAMIVRWRTSLATRRGRGRSFIGPLVSSAAENNGTPEESNRSSLQNAVNALVASSTAENAPPWAVGIWSPTDNVLRDVTQGVVPNSFGVVRSRRD